MSHEDIWGRAFQNEEIAPGKAPNMPGIFKKQGGSQHGWSSASKEKEIGDEVKEFRSSKTLSVILRALTFTSHKAVSHWEVLRMGMT